MNASEEFCDGLQGGRLRDPFHLFFGYVAQTEVLFDPLLETREYSGSRAFCVCAPPRHRPH